MRAAIGVRGSGADPKWIEEIVVKKLVGRKAGKGFYMYPSTGGGKSKADKSAPKQLNPEVQAILAPFLTKECEKLSDEEIVERMVLRFMKECFHSLEDGVIKSAGDGDIGAVFGVGFPPFLGGPFRYADILGLEVVRGKMKSTLTH